MPTPPAADPPPPATGIDASLLQRLGPVYTALSLYSRLAVTGVERVPDGPALLVANHTGWLGLDYAFTVLAVQKARGRLPRGLVHEAWFARPRLADFARRVGLVPVGRDAMRDLLQAGELVMVFPEGERGAFKAGTRYDLQEFARGYVRAALDTGAPIVPVAVLGGEEANPSLGPSESYADLLGGPLPRPAFPFFPKPVKWRIRFLPPVPVERDPARGGDRAFVHGLNDRVRAEIAGALRAMRDKRGHPWL